MFWSKTSRDAVTDPIEEVDECPIEVISAFSSALSDAEINPIERPVVVFRPPRRWNVPEFETPNEGAINAS